MNRQEALGERLAFPAGLRTMLIHRTSIVPISICVALLLGACASKVSNIAVESSGGAVATGGSGGASSPVLCIFNQQSYVPGAAVPAPNTWKTR